MGTIGCRVSTTHTSCLTHWTSLTLMHRNVLQILNSSQGRRVKRSDANSERCVAHGQQLLIVTTRTVSGWDPRMAPKHARSSRQTQSVHARQGLKMTNRIIARRVLCVVRVPGFLAEAEIGFKASASGMMALGKRTTCPA